jgi:hypothetical protein
VSLLDTVPLITPYAASGTLSRLTPSGYYFVDPSGTLVIRRSITAFTAPKRFAEGRGSEARDYFDWAAAAGFTEIRVFSQVDWDGVHKGVEAGWGYSEPDLEACVVEAAAAGLRVEVVAHTFTYDRTQMAQHLQRVDALCARHDSCLLEILNEPQVNGGNQVVSELLDRYTPRTPGWASGVYEPTPDPRGPSLTYHPPRKPEWSRCFKDAIEFQSGSGPTQGFQPSFSGPVHLDEPPQVEQTLRDQGSASAADDWEAYGAGAAFFAAGATLHGNPGFQQCTIPGDPGVLACVTAFIRGLATVPLQRYHGYSGALTPPSADPGSRRYQRTGDDGALYEITVRPFSFRRL